jgi:hypothetical protein
MQDTNPNNQSLNSVGGLPPLPTTATTTTTTTTTGNIGGETSWPGKKKNNTLKYIFGGLLALILVLGTAFGAFYFTRNLNQASTPNAPESKPQAAAKSDGKGGWYYDNFETKDHVLTDRGEEEGFKYNKDNGRLIFPDDGDNGGSTASTANSCSATGATGLMIQSISSNSAVLKWTPGVGNYTKHWVSTSSDPTGACNPLPNKTTNATCVVNENGSLVGGDSNHADIPASTTTWRVNNLAPNTTYYWRMMMWVTSGCDSASPTTSFKTLAAATCTDTTWTPDPALTCVGTNVTQTSNCGTTKTTPGTKTTGTCCTSTTWTPANNTVCVNTAFVQTDNCTATRSATGTKTGGTCDTCTSTTWTPAVDTKCINVPFVQTSNCTATRSATGTKTGGTCTTSSSEGDLSIEKRAYEDEEDNSAGDYDLANEIDSISKNQIFVYAFEITNDGDNKVEDIKVVDTLKGDNTDLLTYVDGDDRCTYASSTRKVTCDGMDLDGGESDTYAFRVKVSNNAINGDTIMNAGEITYKNMPSGGEVDASSELTISTVVGCNHVCTSDDECSTGLTCDTDTNKCRKPACADASSCNCPVERVATEAPTRRATVARAEPTELVEAGILDFPGIATFGGGLLLAVIGILLAL